MHPKITSIGEDESLQAIIGDRWPKIAENEGALALDAGKALSSGLNFGTA